MSGLKRGEDVELKTTAADTLRRFDRTFFAAELSSVREIRTESATTFESFISVVA
jgi:hypothetical protein